jgi:hypothetical protein
LAVACKGIPPVIDKADKCALYCQNAAQASQETLKAHMRGDVPSREETS